MIINKNKAEEYTKELVAQWQAEKEAEHQAALAGSKNKVEERESAVGYYWRRFKDGGMEKIYKH